MPRFSWPTLKADSTRGNQKLSPADALLGVGAAAASAPRVGRTRTSHRITIEGSLYTLLAMLIGLAALNTGANLLYFMLALMLAVLIINSNLARRNLRKIVMERSLPLEFHADEHVHGYLVLHNRKALFSSYGIRVHDTIIGPVDAEGKPSGPQVKVRLGTYALEVPPHETAHLPVEFSLPHRGLYLLQEARLVSRYPFGFFEKSRRWIEPGKLLVYPPLLPIMEVMRQCSQSLGDLNNDRKGQGSSLYGVRDYQPGDPMRLIHWRLSAKGHGWKVKEFEQEESRTFVLMLDLRCPTEMTPTLRADFEKAVSLAATLARLLLQRDARVGLWTTLGNIPPDIGHRHLQRILRALAQVQPLRPDAAIHYPEIQASDATQLWMEYQAVDNRAARAGSVIRRGPNSQVIDVRKFLTSLDVPRAVKGR